MKTYIFIIRRMTNITGAQQYVYNKMKFLENQGWRVLIFSSVRGEILIHDFRRYENLILPTLYFTPYYYKKKEVNFTINKILDTIGEVNGRDCIVESDSFSRAVWAELIAKRLNCRHLSLLVQENHKPDKMARDFLRFKYDRHELAGIASETITQIFNDPSVQFREDARFHAYCNNVIEDCADTYSEMLDKNADYTLGSLGRLSKACVPHIVDGFCAYASDHPDKLFNVVMIGGPLSQKKFLKEKLDRCSNVNSIFTNNMYPVPKSFIEKFDVFVSTAGAATATYLAGSPTVKVNPLDGNPVGIIGLDFNQKSMYDSTSDFTIADCIDRAIKRRSEINFSRSLDSGYHDRMQKEFCRQLSFIEGVSTNEYYNEKLLMKMKSKSHYPNSLLWLLGHVSSEFQSRILKIKKF